MKTVIYGVLMTFLFSCGKEEEVKICPLPIDLTIVEGKYVGVWNWEFGTGDISIIIRSSTEVNSYFVDFFESSNFMPMFNADGVTPEALGRLTVDDGIATIELNLNTDSPECAGNYDGKGNRTKEGVLELTMDIMHDCAQDAQATWRLTKVEDL